MIEYIVERIQAHLESITSGVLLHGDLSPLHIWVDPTSQMLTSILDFGERMVGDPLWDFVDYDWDDVSAVGSACTLDTDPSPIFGATFYTYALLRAIPWAHKWHSRGAIQVLDWLKITLTRARQAVRD
jgi:aminoglycoside phosphotransferase (APT) family kinase protein